MNVLIFFPFSISKLALLRPRVSAVAEECEVTLWLRPRRCFLTHSTGDAQGAGAKLLADGAAAHASQEFKDWLKQG